MNTAVYDAISTVLCMVMLRSVLKCDLLTYRLTVVKTTDILQSYCVLIIIVKVLALDLEGVHDLKLHHPSSSVATSNQ